VWGKGKPEKLNAHLPPKNMGRLRKIMLYFLYMQKQIVGRNSYQKSKCLLLRMRLEVEK
jgi:hypothetical protein